MIRQRPSALEMLVMRCDGAARFYQKWP